MTSAESDRPLAELLPLPVTSVEIVDPYFTMFGPGWALNVTCDWALRRNGRDLVSADAPIPRQRAVLEGVVGSSIADTDLTLSLFDPVFSFDDGHELAIRADTELDPWVMHVAGLPYVIVGYGPGGHQEWLAARRQ